MNDGIQAYYDGVYHDRRRDIELLADYSLDERLAFFQEECTSNSCSVLDYGCGPGSVLTGLRGIDIKKSCGVDISETAIAYARQSFPAYRWKAIRAGSPLPFADGSFDVVVSSEVIEHVFDVDGYLREIHRVLKPGGVFGLTCPFHGFLKDLLIVLSGKHEDHFHNPYDPHIRFHSLRSLRLVLLKNSFRPTTTRAICSYLRVARLARMIAVRSIKS
jgi:2-polyprenyl-6-hydroxyphenyl methylase/3-demethylubiquinone-9 3-methyltransferase